MAEFGIATTGRAAPTYVLSVGTDGRCSLLESTGADCRRNSGGGGVGDFCRDTGGGVLCLPYALAMVGSCLAGTAVLACGFPVLGSTIVRASKLGAGSFLLYF